MNDTESYLRNLLDTLHTKLSDTKSLEEETQLVKDIADCHEELVRFLFRRSKVNNINVETYVQQIREDLGDFCLDWAYVSKRAQRKRQSANAQMLRMKLCPDYVSVDAIRLLGYDEEFDDEEREEKVKPNTTKGIFETQAVSSSTSRSNAIQPTQRAKELGHRLRRLLMEHAYTNDSCKTYLQPFVTGSTNRIFDAATFTAQRWNLPQKDKNDLFTLDILVRLFLFGVAVEQRTVEEALGSTALNLLLHDARILAIHPASPSMLVSEVQIYPLSFIDLHLPTEKEKDCFFLTDWPIESLRPTKEAVMSIGYDTLELLSLAGGGGVPTGRLLDLCCGCGIQGIWEALAAKDGAYTELVLSDINPRACRFACANLTLNPFPSTIGDAMKATVYEGELYESLNDRSLLFSKIISNPPFAALPTEASLNDSALFSIGAAADINGTEVLNRIIEEAPLDPNGGMMLLVTELPNIEDSCTLLQSYCPDDDTNGRTSIRVAYVAKDVQTVEEYGHARLAGDATNPTLSEEKKNDEEVLWLAHQHEAGIYNRALALVSLQKVVGSAAGSSLHRYNGNPKKKNKRVVVDESNREDEFLTRKGIKFTRRSLLKFQTAVTQ